MEEKFGLIFPNSGLKKLENGFKFCELLAARARVCTIPAFSRKVLSMTGTNLGFEQSWSVFPRFVVESLQNSSKLCLGEGKSKSVD